MELIPTISASFFDSLDITSPWFYFRNHCATTAEQQYIDLSKKETIISIYNDTIRNNLQQYSAKVVGNTDNAKIKFENLEGYLAFVLTWSP